jgi:alpha-galactosidase
MSIKVAFIGAGSVGFTRQLMLDILTVPELQDTQFAFHDINKQNLERVAKLCKKDIKANKLPAKLTTTINRRKALEGADYVINCTRIGGLDAFKTDIDIPLSYGVDQCVGDTLCAGGIMYGQRNIPQVLAFQKDMKAVAADDCFFLNYSNPMAMNTWAGLDARDRNEGVDMVGLCHGVEGGWHGIAAALGAKDKSEVDIICAGINHQTWYIKVVYKGREVSSERLLRAFEKHPVFSKTEKVRIDMLRRFGYFTTESNGHVSEYVPWYRKRADEINKWIDMSCWINGETGGYLRICTEGRNWFKSDFPKWLAEAGKPLAERTRSSEHGSYIIESMETGRVYRGHFNVRNNGAITNLPDDCIVEVPGYVDALGMHIPSVGDLPQACAATCMASINVQRMAKDAAVAGDVTLLKQAMLHDPLVGAMLDPDEIWQMTDDMLVHQSAWLPNYRRGDINKARKRLAQGKVKTRKWKGAARIKTKSVAELRRDKDASVMQADKAAAQRARDRAKARKVA